MKVPFSSNNKERSTKFRNINMSKIYNYNKEELQ